MEWLGDAWRLGPLLIKKNWLILALAVVCGYLAYAYHLRSQTELRKQINGLISNSFFWFLVTWKVSPLLFKPAMFIHDPFVLLYYRPGNKESLFALGITLGYLFVQLLRTRLSFHALFNSLILFSSVSAFIYYFFSHHPFNHYYMTLYLLVTMGFLLWQDGLSSPRRFRMLLSAMVLGNIGLAYFQPYPYILGISAYLFWPLVLLIGFALEGIYGKIYD